MTLSATAIAVLFLGAGVTLYLLKAAKKTVPWLMLLAGFGVLGALGAGLAWLGGLTTGGTGSLTRALAGASVPLLAVVVVGIILIVHMRPGGKGPGRLTPWLALLFFPLVGTLSGSLATMLNQAPDAAYSAVSDFIATL